MCTRLLNLLLNLIPVHFPFPLLFCDCFFYSDLSSWFCDQSELFCLSVPPRFTLSSTTSVTSKWPFLNSIGRPVCHSLWVHVPPCLTLPLLTELVWSSPPPLTSIECPCFHRSMCVVSNSSQDVYKAHQLTSRLCLNLTFSHTPPRGVELGEKALHCFV